MADPNWTAQYQFNLTPEQNGFTRILYGSPTVTTVTGGTPANRRIEVNSNAGSVVFELSNVPSLNLTNGATIEALVAVTDSGHAGMELTFQSTHFGVHIYTNRIEVLVADGEPPVSYATASNAGDTKVRVTVSPDSTLRVYRNDVILATRQMPAYQHALPRVLFWAEEGGTQTFRSLKYFLGGPFAP
jgi:hypothetical protein